MVIQCGVCKGFVRCDSALAYGDGVRRIRCPHCGREGFLLPSEAALISRDPLPRNVEPAGTGRTDHHEFEDDRLFSYEIDAQEQQSVHEPDIEPNSMTNTQIFLSRKPATPGINFVKWGLASLVVMAFFALLVNLILPGPTGHKFFGGITYQGSDAGSGSALENRHK